MAEKLTFEQQQAVENRGGKLLVSAAAGSGKTKVLVDRLMSYILSADKPVNIDDFLIITYTKAAASELRGKIAAKLSEKIAENPGNKHLQQQLQRLYLAKISTVHGFCTDILRQYAYKLDISADFRVADEGECLQLQIKAMDQVLDAAYEQAQDDPDFCAFIDSQGLGRDDRQIPEILLKVFNSARCHLNPDRWLDWCVDGGCSDNVELSKTPWGSYLVEDLRKFLALQIDAFNRCIAAASLEAEMEKPIGVLSSTVTQLQNLMDCKTWDEIVTCREIDFGRLTFSKKATNLQLAEKIKAVRNACKDGLAKRLRNFTDFSIQIKEDLSRSQAAARGLVGLVRAFEKAYDAIKAGRGVLDFSDLEHKTLDLLLGKKRSGTTAAAKEISDRFLEIMVDEYQDSNEIQDAIFCALTEKRNNCFMVGDMKQSIYQFRLADPSIFIEKYTSYVPAGEANKDEGRKVLLSHNFRSSGGVISAVNDVFSLCMSPEVGGLAYGEEEKLREGIPHIPLNEPEVSLYGIDVEQDTYAEEAAFVAQKIVELLGGNHYVRDGDSLRAIRPEDIVILLRSPGSVGAEYQFALQTKGIRCATADSADLLQTEEIAAVRSVLQIIQNPLQDIPLVAALTSPVFGFTAEDLAALRSADRYGSIYEALQKSREEKAVRFLEQLNYLRDFARLSTVTELLAAVYTQTQLLSIYSSMKDGELRLSNLQAFYQIVSDYESSGPRELTRLLEYLDTAEERGLVNPNVQQENGAVTIMSIHKSKGLEFPVVFLCGLSRVFNQESARTQVLCDKDLGLGLGCVDMDLRLRYPTIAKRAISTKIIREGISEEMRVLYVAMTRARDRLIMTYSVKNLAGDLQDIAMRLDMCSPELLTMDASCPGAWVLQTALTRTEAGAFFELAGKPDCTAVQENPWKIQVVRGSASDDGVLEDAVEQQEQISQKLLEKFAAGLKYDYGHHAATAIPSKLTATQLKGRFLDQEIAEGTRERKAPEFRKPGATNKPGGRSYGNAIHGVMQYICYDNCTSLENIRQEVNRLEQEKLISPEQAQLVDCEKLMTFFSTPFGKRLRNSSNVLREFKFSILEDAEKHYTDAIGEQILLQGVVDCAIIEDDGITIVDFKTDYVTEQLLPGVTEKYKAQVCVYAQALSRIYQMPVKSAMLYFFHMDTFVNVI